MWSTLFKNRTDEEEDNSHSSQDSLLERLEALQGDDLRSLNRAASISLSVRLRSLRSPDQEGDHEQDEDDTQNEASGDDGSAEQSLSDSTRALFLELNERIATLERESLVARLRSLRSPRHEGGDYEHQNDETSESLLQLGDGGGSELILMALIQDLLEERIAEEEEQDLNTRTRNLEERVASLRTPNEADGRGSVFLVNNQPVILPPNVLMEVATAMGEVLLHGARHGAGERTPCKGMLLVAGSSDDYTDENFGYVHDNHNRFFNREIYIQEWRDHSSFILSCFIQDGAMFIEGSTGLILADRYSLELNTRNADQNGGQGHKVASAVGMRGCLAIKCSADSCMVDGQGKEALKIFPAQREPVYVNVAPQH